MRKNSGMRSVAIILAFAIGASGTLTGCGDKNTGGSVSTSVTEDGIRNSESATEDETEISKESSSDSVPETSKNITEEVSEKAEAKNLSEMSEEESQKGEEEKNLLNRKTLSL